MYKTQKQTVNLEYLKQNLANDFCKQRIVKELKNTVVEQERERKQ